MIFDVFNGDADGIFSLVQLQKNNPLDSKKITGVKRDISLLKNFSAKSGDTIRALDLNIDRNIDSLIYHLEAGVKVFYADHHKTDNQIKHENLELKLNFSPNYCTALIVSDILKKKYHDWAIVGAYGDNLIDVANYESRLMGFTTFESKQLRNLGTIINYNSYGKNLDDLNFHPSDLYSKIVEYQSPFEMMKDKASPYEEILSSFNEDYARAINSQVILKNKNCEIFLLEDAPWSRRVNGIFSNQISNSKPDKAIGVLTPNSDGTYNVNIRSPLNNRRGAADVAKSFMGGGGREGAAGINSLPKEKVEIFCSRLTNFYSKDGQR